jgi:transcriptional regulator with XRE-family HTH domain
VVGKDGRSIIVAVSQLTSGARRRASTQAERFGGEVRHARADRALTLEEVGRRAGVSPDTARRIEHGDPGAELDTLCAIGAAVGLDLVLQAYPATAPSLRDSGQLIVAQYLCSLAHASWKAELEVPAGDHGEAIDVGFFGAREIIDVEIDRLILDWQKQHRRNVLKRDHLAARHQRPVRLVVAIEDTVRNRSAVAPHLPFIHSVLPAGTREVLRALRTGEPLGRDGLIWIRRSRISASR